MWPRRGYESLQDGKDPHEQKDNPNQDISRGEASTLFARTNPQPVSSSRTGYINRSGTSSSNEMNLEISDFDLPVGGGGGYTGPSTASSVPRNSRQNGTNNGGKNFLLPFVFVYVIMVVALAVGYFELNDLRNQMSNSVTSLSLQQSQMSDIMTRLVDQEAAIQHLSNISNAHVLQQLDVTRGEVYTKLTDTRAAVKIELQQAQANVTQQILANKAVLDAQLARASSTLLLVQQNVSSRLDRNAGELKSTVETTNAAVRAAQRNINASLALNREELHQAMISTDAEIAQAENNVTRKLAQSTAEFKAYVATATDQIQLVQNNVTQSLAQMSGALEATAAGLNLQVASAESQIHDEVQAVQSAIEDYVAFTNKKFASENDFVRYQLAGTFTLLGVLISMWHITSHLRHYYKPDVQRRVMAVLWMVPIYSITSWFSLVLPRYDAGFSAIRDCYEAYAVYTFIALLIAILEDGKGLTALINTLAQHVSDERKALNDAIVNQLKRPPQHLRPPFPCCYGDNKPATVAAAWLFQCKLMAMQFVMMKPLLTALPFVLRMWPQINYDGRPLIVHQTINWQSAKLYILLAQNFSVAVAFYALLSFFHGTQKDLEWCNPWPKFLCIKGVVFMTFWQGVCIQGMGSMGMVDEKSALQIQNLLICIEMMIASVAHYSIFPYIEWNPQYKHEKVKGILLRDTLALRDFVTDMQMMVTRWEMQPDMVADNSTGTMPSGSGPFHDLGAGSDPSAGDDDDLTPTAQLLHAKYQQYLMTQQQQRREKLERERHQANSAGLDLGISLPGLGSHPLFGSSSHQSYTPSREISREIHSDQHGQSNSNNDNSSPLTVNTHTASASMQHPIFPWGIGASGVGGGRTYTTHTSSLATRGGGEPSLSDLSLPQTHQHGNDGGGSDPHHLVAFDDTPYQHSPPEGGGGIHSNHSTGSRDRDRGGGGGGGGGGGSHTHSGNHTRNVEMEMGDVSDVVAAVAAAIGNIDQNMADLADMQQEGGREGGVAGVTWRDASSSTLSTLKGTTAHGLLIGSGGGLLLNRGLASNHTMSSYSRSSLASSGSLNSGGNRSSGMGMGMGTGVSLSTHAANKSSSSPDYIEKDTNKVRTWSELTMRSHQLGYHDEGEPGQGSSDSDTDEDGDGENKARGGGGGGGAGAGAGAVGGGLGRIAGPFRSSSSSRGHALFRWVDSEPSLDVATTGDGHTSSNENILQGGGSEIEMDSVASGEEHLFRTTPTPAHAHAHVNMGNQSPSYMGRPGPSPSPSNQLISSLGGSGEFEFSLRSVSSVEGTGRGTNSPSLLQVIEFDDDEEDGLHAMIASSSMGALPPSSQDFSPPNDVVVVAEEEVSV